ncbi:muts domain V-domain-containing protein [Hygrophoropsis aurantiaca]|uniref:Muts domain V-domain-containing protein n=1 Tax=Hygrophoropsis aurantiaca TaxID=72124 RepID=A0ACB8A9N9_9AGAM|nr:muts domain V-domain-containing protein [Hygrophoropsis aurantiaca]
MARCTISMAFWERAVSYFRVTSGTARPWTAQSRSGTARPWTAQSRPGTARQGTARPQTAVSTRHEATYVVSLLESRGSAHEVGMAALDKETGRVMFVQLSDCPTYVKTLHQLHVHPPSLILVPDTFLSAADAANTGSNSGTRPTFTSLLVQYIMEEFPHVQIEAVARKYWNDSAGLEFITQLCVEDDERAATLVTATEKYYALSAICALFKHAEYRLNTRFSAYSLRIRYVPVEGTMMIDPETARSLELVNNITHKKLAHSLFGVLNHTYTAMASRLLRTNILSPITVHDAIEARLESVEELVQSEDKFSAVRDALKTLNKMDFDKLISSLAATEVHVANTAKSASTRVSQMLSLRNLVKNLPFLEKALGGSKSQLLRIVHDMVADDRLVKIETVIAQNLNDDVGPAKQGGIAGVNARVYAVKANRNRLLDVARETYKENVGDIHELCTSLCAKHSLPLTLVYQESGFVLALKKDELEGELPKGFLHVSMQKGRWLFSALELKKLNARMKDALDETLILSDKVIQDLISEILAHSGALYTASEAVALVDLLWSFAHTAIMHNYVRPEFTGTLAMKAARHPILETVQSAGTTVPNDVYCCDSSYFQIIQGPNMSGKSTYLRQIGLLTIMAMCGSFVPAEYASFRIHDAILSRLSNDDDIEKSLSTFANEMASSAMILGLATSKSLVLIDELGRGTSPIEGVGISHAIAEELIKHKCFVFFATHFQELVASLSRQPAVVNLHLAVQRTRQTTSSFGMMFQYKIVDGASEDTDHYGLELARLADFPRDVTDEGRRVAIALANLDAQRNEESRTTLLAIRRRALLKLRTQLTQTFEYSTLPDEELVAYLARFQREIVKVMHETL